jgi:hypothetical protein
MDAHLHAKKAIAPASPATTRSTITASAPSNCPIGRSSVPRSMTINDKAANISPRHSPRALQTNRRRDGRSQACAAGRAKARKANPPSVSDCAAMMKPRSVTLRKP